MVEIIFVILSIMGLSPIIDVFNHCCFFISVAVFSTVTECLLYLISYSAQHYNSTVNNDLFYCPVVVLSTMTDYYLFTSVVGLSPTTEFTYSDTLFSSSNLIINWFFISTICLFNVAYLEEFSFLSLLSSSISSETLLSMFGSFLI